MNKNKGYTLIEALISIIIISMLGWAIMLSSASIKATARVNRIITDLLAWKNAGLAFYFAHTNEIKDGKIYDPESGTYKEFNTAQTINGKNMRDEVAKYLSISDTSKESYNLRQNGSRWFISFDFPQDPSTFTQIKAKLKARAEKDKYILDSRDQPNNPPYQGVKNYCYIMVVDTKNR